MKTKEIASAYQISVQAVNKWSKTKRQQAIRLLSAGVNPQIMELAGEVQRLCYAASMVLGETVVFAYCYDKTLSGHFNVHYFTDNDERIDISMHVRMTTDNLNGAISTLTGLINK